MLAAHDAALAGYRNSTPLLPETKAAHSLRARQYFCIIGEPLLRYENVIPPSLHAYLGMGQ